jgi:hypothetical protein
MVALDRGTEHGKHGGRAGLVIVRLENYQFVVYEPQD